jgi:hypothetical protein
MGSVDLFVQVIKIVIAVSIFFVWVVRYPNIVEEFNSYRLPNWLRDLVGILKLSSACMLVSADNRLAMAGALSLSILMVFALLTHLKVKNPINKMIPAFFMLLFSFLIYGNHSPALRSLALGQ